VTKTIVALVLAALWSVALLAAALVVPEYQSSSSSSSTSAVSASRSPSTTIDQEPIVTSSSATLVEVNGIDVLGVVGIPLLAVIAVAAALWRRRVRGRRGVGPFAWTVVVLLSLFTLVAMLSIGIFIVPVTGLVILACAFVLGAPEPGAGRSSVSWTGVPEFPPG
jgi:hypothetical protein